MRCSEQIKMKFNETIKPIDGELIIEWDSHANAYRVKYIADNISGNYYNHVASFKRLRLSLADCDGRTQKLSLALPAQKGGEK